MLQQTSIVGMEILSVTSKYIFKQCVIIRECIINFLRSTQVLQNHDVAPIKMLSNWFRAQILFLQCNSTPARCDPEYDDSSAQNRAEY